MPPLCPRPRGDELSRPLRARRADAQHPASDRRRADPLSLPRACRDGPSLAHPGSARRGVPRPLPAARTAAATAGGAPLRLVRHARHRAVESCPRRPRAIARHPTTRAAAFGPRLLRAPCRRPDPGHALPALWYAAHPAGAATAPAGSAVLDPLPDIVLPYRCEPRGARLAHGAISSAPPARRPRADWAVSASMFRRLGYTFAEPRRQSMRLRKCHSFDTPALRFLIATSRASPTSRWRRRVWTSAYFFGPHTRRSTKRYALLGSRLP